MRFYFAAAAAALILAAPASASVLVADSGWQDDTLSTPGVPTDNSAWTFTITKASILSVTDAFLAGDTFTLSGDVTGTTTFYAGSASDVQATGSYGSDWLSAAYSKIAVSLSAGTYSFSITGPGQAGTPAGLGVRLDTALSSGVPEPATWALMILGFGAVGGAMRRRQSVAAKVRFA